ncbi:MAG: hypothetical protein KC502_23165 [Myxococcales bacterium]|nr:hypothetical protein [Myxococcales bacterium]
MTHCLLRLSCLFVLLVAPPALSQARANPPHDAAVQSWPLQGPREVPAPAAEQSGHRGLVGAMHRLRIFVLARVWNDLLTLPRAGTLGGPTNGLSWQQLLDFADGKRAFSHIFRPDQGLGPHYNQVSCASCHRHPSIGGESDSAAFRIHVRPPAHDPNDTVSARMFAIEGVTLEPKGDGGQRRRTPALYGLGLLDAVPDAALVAIADPDDKDGDGISGEVNRREFRAGAPTVARFGQKSNDLNLLRFHAGALSGEMGITNPLSRAKPVDTDKVTDPEVRADFVARIDGYVRYLAPPRPKPATKETTHGLSVFERVGCGSCHRAQLGDVRGAYTDMLLHDVGPALTDGMIDGKAGPTEWRTPPLWGLRHRSAYLHDQRTTSLTEAIRLHGGEASGSLKAFKSLATRNRTALLAWLRSL